MLMSRTRMTAGYSLAHSGSPREAIKLATMLWNIECLHQLGGISRVQYLKAVRSLRKGFESREK